MEDNGTAGGQQQLTNDQAGGLDEATIAALMGDDGAGGEAEQPGGLLADGPAEGEGGDGNPGEGADDETAAAAAAGEAGKAPADDATVDIDGRKVTVREMRATFSTFTRKTQELAEAQRQNMSQAREAVAQFAQQQAQQFFLMSQQLDQLVAPGFDQATLTRLAFEDPAQYQQVRARLDVAASIRQEILRKGQEAAAEANRQRQMQQQEAQQSFHSLVQSEGEKLKAQKWWNDDFRKQALAFAAKHGIPEEAAGNVAYAGFVEITRKAMLYDEAVARAKNGRQPPKASSMTPGATPQRGNFIKQKALDASYAAAKTGDKAAMGRYLNQVLT